MPAADAPPISVVVPTFDRAAFVVRAVRSALAQTLAPAEVVVVDDASGDDTAAALAALGDPRVRLVRHPERRGGAAARNTGIDAARGAWLALLDSDDTWRPGKLEAQARAVRAAGLGPDDAWLCFTQTLARGRAVPRRAPRPGEAPGDYWLLDDNLVQTSTLVLPTRVARQLRFDAALPRHQDLDFFFRAMAAGLAPVFVPEALARWHDDAPGRIRLQADQRFSTRWVLALGDAVSPRARAAFRVKRLLPRAILEGDWRGAAAHWASARGAAPLRQRLAWLGVAARGLATALAGHARRRASRRP
ncbi:MAG TPA: glycosyltransferase [Myxococcota bacterium]|nr:glycosyltransferase [Myxococcota bacterium]